MIKIVIDTNILVSAFVFGRRIKAKLERILNDEQIQVVTSSLWSKDSLYFRFSSANRDMISGTHVLFVAEHVMPPFSLARLPVRKSHETA